MGLFTPFSLLSTLIEAAKETPECDYYFSNGNRFVISIMPDWDADLAVSILED